MNDYINLLVRIARRILRRERWQ